MQLDHIAIWTRNLDEMKKFYTDFLEGKADKKYVNPSEGFESYFIIFSSGARLELMRKTDLLRRRPEEMFESIGYAHMSFSAGSVERVDELTELLREKGFRIIGEPRTTGDGYYESIFLDPDGNVVELTT